MHSPVLQQALRALLLSAFASTLGAQERTLFNVVDWETGPTTGLLGVVASVDVPEYCRFAKASGAEKFLRATGNTPSGSEAGVLLCSVAGNDSSFWFVVFSFDKSGYVKDDEKQTLNAAKLLATIRESQAEANKERRREGFDELEITRWEREPYYDSLTNNLTWSLRVRSKSEPAEGESVNHSVRLLGRAGVMHADLVADPVDMVSAVPAFDSILSAYTYLSGHSYSEWRAGDPVAKYGLAALVAGGAGVAAVKLGFFAKAWKWLLGVLIALKKLAIALVIGIAAFFKRIVGWFRTRSGSGNAPMKPRQPPPVRAGPDPFRKIYPPGHPNAEPPASNTTAQQ